MIEENKEYLLKKELAPLLNISIYSIERRTKDLLEWLANFYDYDIISNSPYKIKIKTIIGEYQPLPRKLPLQTEYTRQKLKDYEEFTIKSLGSEFKPNSKSKVARDAIKTFSRKKYSHNNYKAVTSRYVRKPFDEYGETNGARVWVNYNTYKPLEGEDLEFWRWILSQEHMSEPEAAAAWFKQESGEDTTEEKNYYKKARDRFIDEKGYLPVLVSEWRLKRNK